MNNAHNVAIYSKILLTLSRKYDSLIPCRFVTVIRREINPQLRPAIPFSLKFRTLLSKDSIISVFAWNFTNIFATFNVAFAHYLSVNIGIARNEKESCLI